MFITVDGPNGAGKTTIIQALSNSLRSESIDHVVTKEPTTNEIGTLVRNFHDKIKNLALACLISADRYQHLNDVIKPSLECGKVVISDRYFTSSLVYQQLDGVDLHFIEQINSRIIQSDLNVIVFCKPTDIKRRLLERSTITRFEKDFTPEDEEQLYQQASKYLKTRKQNVLEIDNSDFNSVEESVKKIREQMKLIKMTQP